MTSTNIQEQSLKKRSINDTTEPNKTLTKKNKTDHEPVQPFQMPSYSDDSDDDSSDSSDDEEMKDLDKNNNLKYQNEPSIPEINLQQEEKVEDYKLDPKYAQFYARFQKAARQMALSTYNLTDEKDEFGNLKQATGMEPENDADKEIRQLIQQRENEAIPQGLVPLPVPDLINSNDNDNNDDTPNISQLRKKMNLIPLDSSSTANSYSSKPIHISSSVTIPFDQIDGLLPSLKTSLIKDLKFTTAFAVQAALLPPLLDSINNDISPDPKPDILVNAATGSGKTLAYTIPIVQALSKRVVPQTRAVILLPTRPLITQIMHVFKTLAQNLDTSSSKLRIVALHGDHTLKSEQEKLTKNVPDIIVSTPGRLVDHIQLANISLKKLQYLVVDEADRLLGDSFNEWASVLIKEIEVEESKPIVAQKNKLSSQTDSFSLSNLATFENMRFQKWYRPVQKMIFSATLTRDPGKLAMLRIRNPQVYIVGGSTDSDNTTTLENQQEQSESKEFNIPTTLKEVLVPIKSISVKPLRLLQLISFYQTKSPENNYNDSMKSHVLVFVNTNEAAARLARLLTLLNDQVFHLNLKFQRCSGEQPAPVRRKVLKAFSETLQNDFKSSTNSNSNTEPIHVLICTDLVARGIDIAAVKNVINYDIPRGPREYVHRVGRTARAGQEGTAWSFATDRHEHGRFWRGIAAYIHREGKSTTTTTTKQHEQDEMEIDSFENVNNNNNDQHQKHEEEFESPIEKFLIEELVPQEGTREYQMIEEGYSKALALLGKEVQG